MYMSSLLLKRGGKMKTPLSPLRCTGLIVVEWRLWRWEDGPGKDQREEEEEEGGHMVPPPSGIAIILQTECHALQTADKKTVTITGW